MGKTRQEIINAFASGDEAAIQQIADDLREEPEIRDCIDAIQDTARRCGHRIVVRTFKNNSHGRKNS